MPDHNLNAAQAYIMAVFPLILWVAGLSFLGIVIWSFIEVLAEE